MKRVAVFIYGVIAYIFVLAAFVYGYGFLGNVLVPKTIDSGPTDPFWTALLINLGLLAVFAIQHSVMARPSFKRWWTKIIPQPAERATYCLASCLALFLLFWQWRPMGGVIWDVDSRIGYAILFGLYTAGWLIVLAVTFVINHFDLFGLRQVWLYLRGKEYTRLRFIEPGPYSRVRHPLYIGWLLAFWATPTMTAAHLVFAVMTTAYILVAIQLEERNLAEEHPQYAEYRKRVPMLIPRLSRNKPARPGVVSTDSQAA